MKHTLIPLIAPLSVIFHFSLFLLPSSAAVPLKWTVDTSRVQPATFDAYQGETLTFEAALQSYGKPLAAPSEYAIYWQTNGMGSAWWVRPCTVPDAPRVAGAATNVLYATFSPDMDVGAKVYSCFIGLSNSIYRAAFQLRLRPSPGAVPNLIEQPPRILDLAHTVVINPPWPTQDDFSATTAVMRSELKEYVDSQIGDAGVVSPQIATNIASGVASNVVTRSYVEKLGISAGLETNDVRAIVEDSVGGTNAVKAAVAAVPGLSESVRILDNYSVPGLESSVRRLDESVSSHESQLSQLSQNKRDKNDYEGLARGDSEGYADRANGAQHDGRPWLWPEIIGEFSKVKSVNGMTGDVEIAASDVGAASAADVSTLNLGFSRLYSFSTGATNANISVTNYPPTAAEAEGRTHFDPTDPDLDFSTVPASMRLDETRGGEKRTVVDTRDWTVWFFGCKLPKVLDAAQDYAHAAYTNALAHLSAWADRTARGLENPAGESTLVIDVPNIWLMTDQTFEKHVSGSNSCWVIRSKNAAVSPNVATNGFLELTDAFGTPYVRFNKTEATFADPPASGIYHDDEADEWIVTYETDVKPKGGANLAIEGDENYPGKAILKAEDDALCPAVITWTGSSGHWLMHAKPKPVAGADPDKMFFGAVVEIEGQDYIEYLKPVSFSHIVLPNGKKIAPDVPAGASAGTTVSWKVVE